MLAKEFTGDLESIYLPTDRRSVPDLGYSRILAGGKFNSKILTISYFKMATICFTTKEI